MLEVNEIFHSIQGEGVDIGEFVCFVRLSKCNLRCVWCDTKYALGGGTVMPFCELERHIFDVPFEVNKVVFTGGEPGLQAREIWNFIYYLEDANPNTYLPDIAFETNGAIHPREFPKRASTLYTVSPKLRSACENGYSLDTLRAWRYAVEPISLGTISFLHLVFKFVITNPQDLDEAANILKELDIAPRMSPFMPVVFQPNGLTDDYPLALRELYGWVTELHPELIGFVRILPQLHRIMWGNKRGV
jgi:7-carboxy-7-deazaguanine synthase